MNKKDLARHWENIYQNKAPEEMSWTQDEPVSLEFIRALNLPSTAKIIDVGGGNSNLADELLRLNYSVEVLDISQEALEKTKNRLGEKASQVKWIHQNILEFHPDKKYAVWHDRAAFHFLTDSEEIKAYQKVVQKADPKYLIIGTFAMSGPEKCSGLPVKRYSSEELNEIFKSEFELLSSVEKIHHTPWETAQHFIFCIFKKRK